MKNYQALSLRYQSQHSASVNNSKLWLDNSSHHAQPHSINAKYSECMISHWNTGRTDSLVPINKKEKIAVQIAGKIANVNKPVFKCRPGLRLISGPEGEGNSISRADMHVKCKRACI